MAFDDLAKHMAARDGKKKLSSVPLSAEQFLAEEAIADKRRDRTRNLVLGSILLLGGLGAWVLFFFARADAATPGPNDTATSFRGMWMIGAAASALAIAGLHQLIRGIRGRSGSEPIIDPFA